MIPKINIRISFAQSTGGESTGNARVTTGSDEIQPPDLPVGDVSEADVPLPPASEVETFDDTSADTTIAPPPDPTEGAPAESGEYAEPPAAEEAAVETSEFVPPPDL